MFVEILSCSSVDSRFCSSSSSLGILNRMKQKPHTNFDPKEVQRDAIMRLLIPIFISIKRLESLLAVCLLPMLDVVQTIDEQQDFVLEFNEKIVTATRTVEFFFCLIIPKLAESYRS